MAPKQHFTLVDMLENPAYFVYTTVDMVKCSLKLILSEDKEGSLKGDYRIITAVRLFINKEQC